MVSKSRTSKSPGLPSGGRAEGVRRAKPTLTISEMVATVRLLEPAARTQARIRQRHGKTAPGRKNTASACAIKGNALDLISGEMGKDPKTLRKAGLVVAAAARKPAKFAPLVEQMDRTGKVDGAFKQLRASGAVHQTRRSRAGHAWTGRLLAMSPTQARRRIASLMRDAIFLTRLIELMPISAGDAQSLSDLLEPADVTAARLLASAYGLKESKPNLGIQTNTYGKFPEVLAAPEHSGEIPQSVRLPSPAPDGEPAQRRVSLPSVTGPSRHPPSPARPQRPKFR
jgi:hypothetical protein